MLTFRLEKGQQCLPIYFLYIYCVSDCWTQENI